MEIKVLLIRAPSAETATISPPLGLAYLAAVLAKEKIPVEIIDAPVLGYSQKKLLREAQKFKPTVIGFGGVTQEFPSTLKTATNLKKHLRDCSIFIGGSHVSATPKETVQHKCFDVAILGEAEKTMVELVKTLAKRGNLDKVKGIAFKKGRKVVITPPRPFIKTLDTIPFPAHHLLPPLEKYHPTPGSYKSLPMGCITTSRGCPFQCVFCSRSVFGQKIRLRSPKNVVDEIELLVNKYGAREIRFWDDTLNFKPSRVIEICKEISKRKLKITWSCLCRVNFVNLRMLRWMKKAGCWQISYGIESGNQKILNRIKKGTTLEMARQAVAKTKKAGIEIKGFLMIGLPGDTEETMQQTIDFAKELDLDIAAFSITIPFPGTQVYTEAVKSGELKTASFVNYTPYTKGKLPFVPRGLTAKKLIEYQKKAYREFYFRPRVFLRELSKIRSLAMLKAKIQGFFSIQT